MLQTNLAYIVPITSRILILSVALFVSYRSLLRLRNRKYKKYTMCSTEVNVFILLNWWRANLWKRWRLFAIDIWIPIIPWKSNKIGMFFFDFLVSLFVSSYSTSIGFEVQFHQSTKFARNRILLIPTQRWRSFISLGEGGILYPNDNFYC